MNRTFRVAIVAILGVIGLFGCSSDNDKPTSAQEKKDFSGGPMPPEARKQFEESRNRGAQRQADHIAKSKADAATAAAPGTQ